MASDLTSGKSRIYQRRDTVPDAEFVQLSIDTPLVFARQPSESIPQIREEDSSGVEFPGPHKWDDIEKRELTVEAERILRNFAKTPEGEFDVAAVSAPAEDLTDRLGRGFLDPSAMTLVTEDGLASLTTQTIRRSIGSAQVARLASRKGFARGAGRSREERRRQELKDKILPSSGNFSPEFYLSHVHADTSLEELHDGMVYLEEELSKRTSQLKTLVREHFEGFISCKNSIDDVHVRLRRNEAQNSGANTSSLKGSLALVQTEVTNSFAPILARHDKVEHLKHVMEILKKFQSSFNLPSNIRQLSCNRDFQQVVSEYRRAKSTMATAEVPIWQSLFEEVKKEMTDVCTNISKSLEDPMLHMEEVQEQVICICQLKNEGLEFASSLEPVMLWLTHVEDHVHQELRKLTDIHRRQIEWSGSGEKLKKRTPSPFDQASQSRPVVSFTDAMIQSSADFINQLCKLLVKYLPKLWKLKRNSKLREMADVNDTIRNDIADELDYVDTITKSVLDCFSRRIVETMEGMLMSDGLLSPSVFSSLRVLRLFAADMKDCPAGCLIVLSDLIHECFEMCVNYLCTFLRQQMASLGEWEDWKIRIGSYCRGHPVTSVPYKLGQAVQNVMEQFRQIKAEQDQWLDGSSLLESNGLNNAFNECFESFAVAVEGLAAEILEPKEPANQNPQMPEFSKLLILISNSMYIRKRILPDLTGQYSEFIAQPTDISKNGNSLLKQFRTLEETMVQAYVDHAKKIVEKAVDVTIAAEVETPPLKLSDFNATVAPIEWIAVVDETYAELLKYAPSKCDVVIPAMVLHLVKRMKLRVQDIPHLGFLLQMYIDAMFLETVFKGVDVREVHKAWDAIFERLNNLIITQIRSMKAKPRSDFEEDTGSHILRAFSDADVTDVMSLDGTLQKMFKEGVRESIHAMSINLMSMRSYKTKEKPKNSKQNV